jgi:exopolysaccharide production protein ExoZ
MLDWFRTNFELGGGTRRLIPMEGLRGFAVSLVFLQHYTTQNLVLLHPSGATKAIALAFQNYGNLGVEMFFVLSGYLIYGALLRRPTFARFMARRAQRIYPAFIIAFGIALSLALAFPAASKIPHEPGAAALYIAQNLLLLPGVFHIEPIMAVAWSLSYEMFFYLATGAAVVALTLDRWNKPQRIALILTLASALTAANIVNPEAPIRMVPFFAGMLLVEIGESFAVPAWVGLGAPPAAFLVTIVFPVHRPGVAAE